jgi:hypothetical protein
MNQIKFGLRGTRSGKPPGRPRLVTPELAQRAAALRAEGKPWASVAQFVGLKAETCRRAGSDLRRAVLSH